MIKACFVSFWCSYKIQFDLEVVCSFGNILERTFSRLTLIRCCSGGREPIQQPSAAAGALRQVARKRPGRPEGPHQGERRRAAPITAIVSPGLSSLD